MLSESSKTTSSLEFSSAFRNKWLVLKKKKSWREEIEREGLQCERSSLVLSLTMVLSLMFFVSILCVFSLKGFGENHSRLPRRVPPPPPLESTAPLTHQGWTSASDESVQTAKSNVA